MGGQPVMVGEVAHRMRKQLYLEHIGMDMNVNDPLDPNLIQKMNEIAIVILTFCLFNLIEKY